MHLASEVELQCKLNLAEGKGYGTGDRAKTRNRSTRCTWITRIPAKVRRRTKLRLVQEIKRFHPELQRLGFSEGKVLEQRCIHQRDPGSPRPRSGPAISKEKLRWRRVAAWAYPVGDGAVEARRWRGAIRTIS